jgi:glyoxylase-like metal-dependent hydrolase (beta-lactamase superfamily II)
MPPDLSQFVPEIGVAEDLGANIRRIVAPNPSPMTYRGTNTYLLGKGDLAVIDPGPDNQAHLAAILRAVGPHQRISHILVTHAHVDHSPLAAVLSRITAAPVFAYGDATNGRSKIMQRLSQQGLAGGGEGIDMSFYPDIFLPNDAEIIGDGWQLTALHTPGHIGNHLCFKYQNSLFTGDLVMVWASSLVSPPDGDLTDFMRSCCDLQKTQWQEFHPGHGAPVTAPNERLAWLIAHRKGREAEIIQHLHSGPTTAFDLASRIYTSTPPELLPAATRNVLAHLIDLTQRQRVRPLGVLSQDVAFELVAG